MTMKLVTAFFLACGALVAVPNAAATHDECVGGEYNPGALTNVCYYVGPIHTDDCSTYLIGDTCVPETNDTDVDLKVMALRSNPALFIDASTGYDELGTLCVWYGTAYLGGNQACQVP